MQLTQKTILLISPQNWGVMHLAKQHYAIELAALGNVVFYLNPPNINRSKSTVEVVSSEYKNLFIVNHSLGFSYKLKFKLKPVFHFLMKYHIKKIEATLSHKIDIVWSFDLGNYYPFKYFSNTSFKIFHPIDLPQNADGINSGKDAQIMFSVAQEILDAYKEFNVPKYFIHHGLTNEFIQQSISNNQNKSIQFGLSGNWLRPDIDRETLLQIIRENPSIHFHLWGSYQNKNNNIGGVSDEQVEQFIEQLKACSNITLHGAINPKELARQYTTVDGFLICYDINKDQSHGTNYHKVMEYLSTGKVVVSNNVTTYKNLDVLEMTTSRNNNEELSVLFKKVAENIDEYNSQIKQQHRRNFAASNLYSHQIKRIEEYINSTNMLQNY